MKTNLTSVWRSVKTRYVFALVSLSWLLLIVLIFAISTVFDKVPNELNPTQTEGLYHKLNARLNEANTQIELLMEQNRQLAQNLQVLSQIKKKRKSLVKSAQVLDDTQISAQNAFPDTAYEQSLRRLQTNTDEIWHFLRKRVHKKQMSFVNELRFNMFYDFDVLSQRDNRWREQQLKNLSHFVQNRIERLQNPSDCSVAKKLVCDLNKYCGFGCQVHHLAHCVVAAMALNRTLIVKTDEWRTSSAKHNVWNQVFQPFSQTCVDPSGHNSTHWSNDKNLNTYQVIYYPIIDFIDPIPDFLPLVIPQQISEPLLRLSSEPFIWFIGQVLKYVMRPSNSMSAYIDKFKTNNGFTHPMVGMHVRRTDKIGTEANFHPIDEYMFFVEDFYNKLDFKNERNSIHKKVERSVYLATDEPNVWRTEISSYKEKGYRFTGDIRLSESADPSQRHSFESLRNVVVDILLLSQCDYIVCTFSSQICRLAFELMQTRLSSHDMSSSFYSLDDIYYFGGQVFHGKKAIISHSAQTPEEFSFSAGDVLGIANNRHNGYNYGDHNRTKVKGLYPRFKVIEFVESKPFDVFD